MGSLLISLHFTVLPPLGWAIYHSTCTYTHTGMHKQMPLSSAHHKPECAPHLEGEYQIICKHCSIVHTHTQNNRINWTHSLCKVLTTQQIYMLCRLNLIRNLSLHFSPHIFACTRAFFADKHKHTHLCMYSCLQLRGTPLQLWCGSRRQHKRQAAWWKWLVCVNYSSGCQHTPLWDRTHTTRVQGYE